jgi:predicted tellurium resistance membrane protein TerC
VIQQTMVADARARPTSGRTRSNAVNTILYPCFVALLQGTFNAADPTNGGGLLFQRAFSPHLDGFLGPDRAAKFLFLIAKATFEIHSEIDVGEHHERRLSSNANGILLVIVQIALIDLVFSIDSIVTAIGMVQHVEVMIAAVLISMAVMYGASGSVAEFIVRNPSTKMLALSFLILIGVALIADGFDVHIPRGYVYFAMGFAALVETFNILARRRRARRRQ